MNEQQRDMTARSLKRRYAIELMSHRFYNIISFSGGALLHPPQYCYGGRAAPVVGRSARKP